MLRRVKVWRGDIWLGAEAEPLPLALESYAVERWLSSELPADREAATARWVAMRTACQTASGGSFYAVLAARFEPAKPADGSFLRIRVAASAETVGLVGSTADLVLQRLTNAAVGWTYRPAGTLVIDRAATHPVDDKAWVWARCATVLGVLLGPGPEPTDAALDGLVRSTFGQ